MTQDEALQLLSARIDGELTPDQDLALDAWLRDNPDGQAIGEAFRAQHTDLQKVFGERRQAAARTAERVIDQLPPMPASSISTPLPRSRWRHLWSLVPPIAAVAVLAFVAITWLQPEPPHVTIPSRNEVAQARTLNLDSYPHLLVATAKPAAPATAPAVINQTITTGPGEKRREMLPDGSVVYMDQDTELKLVANRHIRLEQGRIYVTAVSALDDPTRGPFLVKTDKRKIEAIGTNFEVTCTKTADTVLVGKGVVKFEGADQHVFAGQQCKTSGAKAIIEPAPRESHELGWARDLMVAADVPLVSSSKYDGGALVAVDPYGQEAKLSMVNYHVDVHIEDGFARTTIDQTYFNHENMQMEGTFYFPLPPDASLSRLAMYVADGQNCNLMEGGMAERDIARQTYEKIRHARKDPALLEWVDGSLFKMRVFPLEPRQEKRLVLSYSQKLPVSYGKTSYRFPAGHSLNFVDKWSFAARVKKGDALQAVSPSHPRMKITKKDGDLLLSEQANKAKVDRDVVLELTDAKMVTGETANWSCAEFEGANYLMLRYKPELPSQPRRERRDLVFLFEASGARDPLVARAQIEVIRALLSNAEHEDTFAVLTAGTHIHKLSQEPQQVTTVNVDKAIEYLEKTHLIGALNIEQALIDAQSFLKAGTNPHLVHVGGGVATLGEQRTDKLIERIPQGTRYVGIAVGKRFSPALMKAAAEKTGGYFTQINPDEPIAWKGFELASTLNTPRLLNITIDDGSGVVPGDEDENGVRFLAFTNALSQGDELAAVTRVSGALPAQARVKGTLNGVTFEKTIPVSNVAANANYLPRTWAKLEIDRLLALDAMKHRQRITDLSKSMYVMTPFTSLLVLENEAMYKEHNIDRGRKDHWAMYACPAKIPVVFIPDPNKPLERDWRELNEQKPHANQVMQTILVRTPLRYLTWAEQGGNDETVVNAGKRYSEAAPVLMFDDSGIHAKLAVLSADGANLAVDPADSALRPEPQMRTLKYKKRAWYVQNATEEFNLKALNDGDSREPADLAPVPGSGYLNLPALAEPYTRGFGGRLNANDIGGISVDFAHKQRLYAGLSQWNMSNGSLARSDELMFEADGTLLATGTTTRTDLNGRSGMGRARLLTSGGGRSLSDPMNVQFAMQLAESNRTVRDFDGELPVLHSPEPVGRVDAILGDRAAGPRYYSRPSFSGQNRVFTDLVAYAPGMRTSRADTLAVIEAEAAPRAGIRKGAIDPEARKRIEAARESAWFDTTFEGDNGESFVIQHDGQGRYVYERKLDLGLIERVVCDGTTLYHLYPELGVGAKRPVSRFHRAELCDLIPDVLPPADDLCWGADVKLLDANTVALVPLQPIGVEEANAQRKHVELHLVFNGNRLAQRKWLLMPEKKLLGSEIYEAGGAIVAFDKAGKEFGREKRGRKMVNAPGLKPDVSQLVILPLPLRSREIIYRKFDMIPNGNLFQDVNACFEHLPAESALELLACEFGHDDSSRLLEVAWHCFLKKGDRRVGFYTLTQSCGYPSMQQSTFRERLDEALAANSVTPLMRYLALANDHRAVWMQQQFGAMPGNQTATDFLSNLLTFRMIVARWQGSAVNDRLLGGRAAERERALAFVRQHAGDIWGWCALGIVADKAQDASFRNAIADTWGLLAEKSRLTYHARYEQAVNLLYADEKPAARAKFEKLFDDTFAKGILPPIDHRFREAYGSDAWTKHIHDTAARCFEKKYRTAVVLLAWQCRQLGDPALADDLLERALKDPADDAERVRVTLAAIEYLWSIESFEHADRLVGTLAAIPELQKQPRMWRLASKLAEKRGRTLRQFECLEAALDREYTTMPEVFSIEPVRNDYRALLNHYQWLAQASRSLDVGPPADLLPRTVKAADRWRRLDPEVTEACDMTAKILRLVGGKEAEALAWDYLTTPLALKPNESGPWLGLATSATLEGNLELADRCYEAAFAAESTNAQILWDRAKLVERRGEIARSRELMTQLSVTEWQPRFEGLKSQAKYTLQGK